MNYKEFCANFKPKQEPSFPQGLRTADLEIGLVVREGNRTDGAVYIILEEPGEVWLKVLSAYPGYKLREEEINLADLGCQPYKSGKWNGTNWLREVK